MIFEEHIFNPRYSENWQEKLFLPPISMRSVKMALNFLIANLQYKLKMIKLLNYPYFACIDPSSVCNLKCPLCPTGQGNKSRPKCFLSFEDFKKIIDEIGDYLISVLFTNWGEPLLNKDFSKMVSYAKKTKHIHFTGVETNLNIKLSDTDIEELIKSGLDLMCIAVDGATQETYEKYRRGGNLKKVIDNSKRILNKRKELAKNGPFVVWQFMVLKHNQHEIEKIIKLAKETGVDVIRITGADVYTGSVDKSFKYSYGLSKDYLPPLGSKYSDYTKNGKKKRTMKMCQWLWKSIVITSDGSVSPCCNIYPKKYDFGDILKEKSFKAIWNNEKYQNARKSAKDSNYAKKLFETGNICSLCTVHGNWIG